MSSQVDSGTCSNTYSSQWMMILKTWQGDSDLFVAKSVTTSTMYSWTELWPQTRKLVSMYLCAHMASQWKHVLDSSAEASCAHQYPSNMYSHLKLEPNFLREHFDSSSLACMTNYWLLMAYIIQTNHDNLVWETFYIRRLKLQLW